jgi:transcriptional regulator with XRE-family HTH domain
MLDRAPRPITRGLSDPDILAELGRRLRAYRRGERLTIAALARRAGLSPLTLQKAERGANFTMATLVRVLRALGRLEQLEALLPPPALSPLALLESRRPRRAGPPRGR